MEARWHTIVNSGRRHGTFLDVLRIKYLEFRTPCGLFDHKGHQIPVGIIKISGGKKKRVTTTEVSTRKLNVGLVLAPILVINVLAGIVTLNYAYSDLQLNGTFEQYLSALGPVLNDVEEKKLRSDWALMESEADCVKIFRAIADKSGAAGISLPKTSMFFNFLTD